METTARQTTTTHEGDLGQEVIQEASFVGTAVIFVLSILIGAWGVGCLISGFAQEGIFGALKGWITAVMGG